MKSLLILLGVLVLCFLVAGSASYFTMQSVNSWYLTLNKPDWTPENRVFPIVWTVLYTLMSLAFWWVLTLNPTYKEGKKPNVVNKKVVMIPFFIQLFLNFSFSYFFFFERSPFMGMLVTFLLLAAVIWTMIAFGRYSVFAIVLLVPYVLWMIYATALSFSIWYLNSV